MEFVKCSRIASKAIVMPFFLMLAVSMWAQGTESVLHNFGGNPKDGSDPYDALIFDPAGHLYGTTWSGGHSANCPAGCGTVFQLTRGTRNKWTETVLHSFVSGADGANPYAGLVRDRHGRLYGTTQNGGGGPCGSIGCGVVFELTPVTGGGWTENVIYSFQGNTDGEAPYGGLVFDKSGNLYGTTFLGGQYSGGIAFELTPGSNGSWGKGTIYNFGNTSILDGSGPLSGMAFGPEGKLYGVTHSGGNATCLCGTVFELTPAGGGQWTESVLYNFTDGNDGANPYSVPVFDSKKHLYGTTSQGGAFNGGSVFSISLGSQLAEKTLYSFTRGSDGGAPFCGVIFDQSGNLYGTTAAYGSGTGGVVFELKPGSNNQWTETVLYSFPTGDLGAYPYGSLVFGTDGNLYGTTFGGGTGDFGTVFSVTP